MGDQNGKIKRGIIDFGLSPKGRGDRDENVGVVETKGE